MYQTTSPTLYANSFIIFIPPRCPREGCDELFAAISDLTSHLSSSHSNGAGSDGNYKCDKCGAPFDDLAALKIHQGWRSISAFILALYTKVVVFVLL